MELWARELDEQQSDWYAAMAEQVYASFNGRFWYGEGGYLADVIDGENGLDVKLRPNQIFALSLRFPVLEETHWKAVVDIVEHNLLTPFGLRTLDPGDKDYRAFYRGDRRSRDAAYHQGLVWPWLIGHFLDARRRVYGGRGESRRYLGAFEKHLEEAGIGAISEIFEAEAPYTPRGCIAQAWSVAEVLRALLAEGTDIRTRAVADFRREEAAER